MMIRICCFACILFLGITSFAQDTPVVNRLMIEKKKSFNLFNGTKTQSILKFEQLKQMKGRVVSKEEEKKQDAVASIDRLFGEYIDPKEEVGDTLRLRGASKYDSRIETGRLNPDKPEEKKIIANTLAVGIVIERDKIHAISPTDFQLDVSITLGKRYKLCPGEAFANQPAIGIGTAFIVGENQMVTAGHVFSQALDNYVIVFGYELYNKTGTYATIISKDQIFYPKKIVDRNQESDLTIFSTDRPLNRTVLKIGSSTDVKLNTPVYMIGYPSGIPQKVALNASVHQNNDKQFFYTTLDAFQGNSGSPVFNMETHELIGVLVSGEVDYVWRGSCNTTTLCRIPYCKGEKVMRIANINTDLIK